MQALQNWKEQFKGLYRSFGADQPAPNFATIPNPAFAGQRFEPPPGSTANSHEFECAVSYFFCPMLSEMRHVDEGMACSFD